MDLDDITTDANGKVLTVTVDAGDYDRLLKDAVALRGRVADLELVEGRHQSSDALLDQLGHLSDADQLALIKQRIDELAVRRRELAQMTPSMKDPQPSALS